MTIEILHRGRFHPVPDATARVVALNAVEIALPRASRVHALCRRQPTAEAWDGAVFAVDGVEAEPAVGSGEDASGVRVTVLLLGQ